MKTVGIICEYNPFHLGHQRQFDLIRKEFGEDTMIICIMSGNYVQRGVPAMWDKYTRANAAVACGADLVFELPITKVLSSAEGFARGGVEILVKFGCTDILCFGAECGDTEQIMNTARKLNDPTYKDRLQNFLSQGMSYAAAKQASLDDSTSLLSDPNNILGVEYCRAILEINSTLTPFAIKRNGGYHDTAADASEPSATAVRALYPNDNWKQFVPEASASLLSSARYYALSAGERAVLARLRALNEDEWEQCAHGSEGLWSKAMKASRTQGSYEAIVDAVKSKRYPRTRIQRLLLCAYLGIRQHHLQQAISYTRLLAFSPRSRSLLRKIKDTAEISVVNPGEIPNDKDFYAIETRAADLFTLFCTDNICLCRTEQDARVFIPHN
ncbi:MAG: nucleotidyltransferase family protein [Oscillospiraceae bacterium]|nr:nucleotidyltransferase family protein [Oscillospiraceae bacterium]